MEWDRPQPYEGAKILEYIIELLDARDNWVDVYHQPDDPSQNRIKVVAQRNAFGAHILLEGVQYQFRIVAYNQVGPSEASNSVIINIQTLGKNVFLLLASTSSPEFHVIN